MRRTRTALLIAALLVTVLAPTTALAAAGSLVRGVVWADTDRDGTHDAAEVEKGGVTVQLVRTSNGTVVATTTTNLSGVYRFDDVADGSYRVRVTAPGAFDFPDEAGEDNSFASAGQPAPGAPEVGLTAPFGISGATQATGLDAGMRPVAEITVQQLPLPDACEGMVTTGTPPFDSTDGGGKDSGTSNCLVRTQDTTTQRYAVSLTGLPAGTQVDNVVLELAISSADGARTQVVGPGPNGLPTGCLTTGVSPVSAIITNADGSLLVRCNVGTFTSAVKAIQLPIRSLNSSPDESTFHVEASAYAPGGDAVAAEDVVGPDIKVTGIPQWDLIKGNSHSSTSVSVQTVNGQRIRGYHLWYSISLTNTMPNQRGGRALVAPLEFTDKLTAFPEAILVQCYASTSGGEGYGTAGRINCPPAGTEQGADGWPMTMDLLSPYQQHYIFYVRVLVPEEVVYRAIDPGWEAGDPIPDGSVPVGNTLIDTDGWADSEGVPNYDTGFEPGWDGDKATGNNVVSNAPLQAAQPKPGTGAGTGKYYFSPLGGCCAPGPLAPGKRVGTSVVLRTNPDTTITNPMMCDVFDVSALRFASSNPPPAGYLFEYAEGPNADDLQDGPKKANGQYPFDSAPLKAAADGCGTHSGPWLPTPSAFGTGWQDRVNMIRMRPIDPTTKLLPDSSLQMWHFLDTRGRYNGGPHAGEFIPGGVLIPNEGGWTDPGASDGWSTNEAVLDFIPLQLSVTKSSPRNQYLPGEAVPWTLRPRIEYAGSGAVALGVTVTDILPANLLYDATCTEAALPSGVTVSYNPATRTVVFGMGDREVPEGATELVLPPLTVCSTVSPLAKPASTLTNTVWMSAPNASNKAGHSASIQVNGTGELSIQKSVDRSLITSGQTFTWSLDWANTSAVVDFAAPDLIDVLPWNGDAAAGSLSRRNQYSSDFHGTARLTGALAQPTYTDGASGTVPGTWYYATTAPGGIDHNASAATNANPAAPGGLWQTESEIEDGAGIAAVTAVRFVSAGPILQGQFVRARITQRATATVLDNVYVNRARLFSATVPNQTLLSNEPYVLMPGFTLGDLIWRDDDGDGMRDDDEPGVAGVPVEVLDASGAVVATASTGSTGRWSVPSLDEGAYRVRIPATAFKTGGPLEGFGVSTMGSSTSNTENESISNNNTGSLVPSATGLTSTAITFSYTRDAQGNITGGNGPLGDDLAGLTPRMIPDEFTNFTADLALKPLPRVEIVKSTQSDDANAEPGPRVAVGDPVRWTYRVTNTGNTDLVDVVVGDDKLPNDQINCGAGSNVVDGPLAPGATFTCSTTGVATSGQYENNGSVTAKNPETGEDVLDVDPSHYFGAVPDVEIVKSTQGQDADQAPGPSVRIGDVVRWTYRITNTGNTELSDLAVTDDKVAAADIDCGGGSNVVAGPLAPGDSFSCAATGTATAGQYENTGTVVGTSPSTVDVNGDPVPGETVTADNPSHYYAPSPGINLVKTTNGDDANAAPGPRIAVGDPVLWTYRVTNTGNVALTKVTVTDNKVAAADIDCSDGSNVLPDPLEPGDSVLCAARGTAVEGQYANTGTASGVAPPTVDEDGETVPGEKVVDTDPSHYLAAPPAVRIVKSTQGFDANTAPGPLVRVGDHVRWTYRVTNTGEAELRDLAVTDDKVAAADIDCGGGSNVVAGPLAPGDSFSCTANGTAVEGQYANTGDVVGTAPATVDVNGDPVPAEQVSDSDPSHYYAAVPALRIVKSTQRDDANSAPGPTVKVGDPVRWTYRVTNTGDTPLRDVTVTDDKVKATDIDCGDGANLVAGPLGPGESFTCVARGVAVPGQYENTGTAIGTAPPTVDVNGDPVPGGQVIAEDPSHYYAPSPGIRIVKSTNTVDANEAPGPRIRHGEPVVWTYVVTNTGNTELTDVEVTDDKVADADIDCGEGTNSVPGPLAPGEEFTCSARGVAVTGQYENTGTAAGTAPPTVDENGEAVPGEKVVDTDPSHYFGTGPGVQIVKSTNGHDANEAPGPAIRVGAPVRWTYLVTNTGSAELLDVTVTDDKVAAEKIDCGHGTNVIEALAAGDSVTCTATGKATVGQYENTGTVVGTAPPSVDEHGEPVPGEEVTDDDPSHYFGEQEGVVVPPTKPHGGGLPNTGGPNLWLAVTGALLVLAGGLLLAGGRRRGRHRAFGS